MSVIEKTIDTNLKDKVQSKNLKIPFQNLNQVVDLKCQIEEKVISKRHQ